NRFGNESIGFWGMEQQSRKWAKTETYGGKLAENCLAGDTLVLTNSGWKPIPYITTDDLLWDGVEWVNNGGSIFKLEKQTVSLNGIRMTGDHKILTENGWKTASSSEGFNWRVLGVPENNRVRRFGRKKNFMEGKMLVREDKDHRFVGDKKEKTKILRMQTERADWKKQYQTRYGEASGLCSMAFYGGSMQATYASGVAQLRSEGC